MMFSGVPTLIIGIIRERRARRRKELLVSSTCENLISFPGSITL